jgi:hypothetical protein
VSVGYDSLLFQESIAYFKYDTMRNLNTDEGLVARNLLEYNNSFSECINFCCGHIFCNNMEKELLNESYIYFWFLGSD